MKSVDDVSECLSASACQEFLLLNFMTMVRKVVKALEWEKKFSVARYHLSKPSSLGVGKPNTHHHETVKYTKHTHS